ncbi:hypothetical protein G9A89_023790 [Geosiphon pyriformis]|nr:hypothetical protein G9A89_023790 [Geosiphon pyriformis]
MASKIPLLCLNEIFEHLNFHRPTLHSCVLVNRHWCHLSIPALWRQLFPISKPIKVIEILILSLTEDEKKEIGLDLSYIERSTTFNYSSFIRNLDLELIAPVVNDIILQKWDMKTAFKCLNVLAQKIVKSEGILWDLNLDFDTWQDSNNNSLFPLNSMRAFTMGVSPEELVWNLFQLAEASKSLSGLRRLRSKASSLSEVLPLACKISTSIVELNFTMHSPKHRNTPYDQVNRFIPFLPLLIKFPKLETLIISRGKDHDLLMSGDKFFYALGCHLPASVQNLTVEGYLKFSPESLQFFCLTTAATSLKTLAFPEMKFFSNLHLGIVTTFANSSQKFERLEVPAARHITRHGLEMARTRIRTVVVDCCVDDIKRQLRNRPLVRLRNHHPRDFEDIENESSIDYFVDGRAFD